VEERQFYDEGEEEEYEDIEEEGDA